MKEYQYSIIRRESRNPKRNREGRGISQSDLEALKQELEGNSQGLVSAIYDRDIALDSLAVTSGDISERLGAAEEALTGKLDSGDFSKWRTGDYANRQSALDNALAGKQPVGSYVDPSQLATSQQQAVAEAVKQAEEMDKQIKVGGRNLLIGERFSKETTPSREIWVGDITSIIDNNNLIGETVTWSFDLKCDKAHTFSAYQLGTIWFTSYTNATVEAGEWKRVSFTGVVRDTDNPTGSTDRNCILVVYGDYDSGYFPITRHHKLERGTVATDWTPAPEDLDDSISKVNKSLTSLASTLLDPDQGEIHKLTSQLATSQQQAVDEAVRQAGEMDKAIKVGGRNLIRNGSEAKRQCGEWVTYRLYKPIEQSEPLTLSFDVIKVEKPPIGGRFLVFFFYYSNFRTATSVKYEEGKKRYSVSVQALNYNYDLYGDKKDYDPDAVFIYPNSSYDSGGGCFTVSNVKLERGTIATDWTPAPEDVAESVTSLESKLLDPEQGEIHKLETLLGKHSENFEDLATHPLTIDDNGFWKIWSVKDNKYVTTQYQSRGRDGQDGRNGSDGADGKDGHTPRIDWDGTKLIIENMTPVDLRGEAGHSPELHVGEDDYLYVDGVKQRYLRGQRGEDGHNPSPEDVLKTERFKQLLGGEVTSQVKPVEGKLELTKNKTDEALRRATYSLNNLETLGGKINTANTSITSLKAVALTPEMRSDLDYLTDSLKVLRNTDGSFQDIALQRYIALSGNGKDISAYLASNALTAVLKAGIVDFGKPTEREQVAIKHNGTGHIGNLYFEGSQIDFRTGERTDPYLSIGAEESQFIDDFLRTARLDDTPVSVSSVTLTTRTTSDERTVYVANDGTRLTVTIDSIKIETYVGAKTRLTLDGEVLAEWQGRRKIVRGLDNVEVYEEPYTASDLYYERGVKAGRHTLRLEIVQPTDGATATINGLRVRKRYDTGRQQSVLTKSGLRLFGSPDRYLDVDYRRQYYNGTPGSGVMIGWLNNPYTVRIKGGAKVDKLTADELDMPGVPLCGATFNEYGTKINSFGERAKQQGTSVAQAYRAYNTDFYRVYHSIGHKNYIPVLQVYGLSNGNYTQCLTTRIDAIEADSFAVRIVTTGNVSVKHSFSYVAFKTTE